MARFSEFLAHGKLDKVQLGMVAETVQKLLGPSDDRSVKTRPVEIWKFGCVEFVFKHVPETSDARLVAVAIHFGMPDRQLPRLLAFEDWTPTADTTEAEFRKFIEGTGIQLHSTVADENTHLVLESGASAVFVDDRLHSVHFRRVDKAAIRRQMSVSLPESTLAQLHARARRENISVQELIERVLSTSV